MIAAELVNPMLPILKTTDTVGRAIDWLDEHRLNQLVVSNENTYVGVVSYDFLINADEDLPILALQPEHSEIFATENQHLFELLNLVQQNNMDVLPIINQERQLIGSVSTNELLKKFAENLGSQELGAIIEIALDNRNYSLSEISRLIESNDVKILSCYYSTKYVNEIEQSVLTLRLNRLDISRVVATLERFGYAIQSAFANTPIDSPNKDRYDLLMKYLEM
jgi:acetoin utilization protein AcuB